MAGLDAIIEQIRAQADEEVKSIIDDAQQIADEIQSKNKSETKNEVDLMTAKADRDTALLRERMLSSTELTARNTLLQTKQDLIASVCDKTLDELKNLSDEKYIEYIKSHLQNEEAGFVLQEGRAQAVKKALPKLNIIDDRFVEDGFVEVEGKIEHNNTFSSKIHLAREQYQVELAEILFGKI